MRLFKKSGPAMRVFLFNSAAFMMLGIYLTGFDQVHWFMYFIPALYILTSVLGICPGINLWQMILEKKEI